MKTRPCADFSSTLVALCLSLFPAILHSAPTELSSTPVANRLGLTLNEYSLAWKAPAQQRFQILVASDELKLAADVGDLWDSGVRPSAENEIVCRGKAFADGSTVWWKVRTWDGSAEGGAWSAPAKIEAPKGAGLVESRPRPSSVSGKHGFIDGKRGKAINLADRGTVAVGDYAGLRSTGGTTIAAWIRPEAPGNGWQCIYRKEDGARRLLAIGAEGPFWGLWTGFVIGGHYVEFGAPVDKALLADGAWHHVAASFDGEAIRLFLDGEQIGEQGRAGKLSSGGGAPAYIGSYDGSGEWFRGGIDDLRIYPKGLGEEEIAALVGAEEEVAPDQLTAHWRFDGSTDNEAKYQPEPAVRNRIVLLGGTTTYEMEKHGYFEAAVTANWPHHDITFRNLGWPGDDVFGTARSEFGSAQNTRSWKPPGAEAGFGAQERSRQIREVQPTTVIVGYGREVAWADTPEKMRDFEAGYRRLIDELEATGATVILIRPFETEDEGDNERLRAAAKFIAALGEERGLLVVGHDFVENRWPDTVDDYRLTKEGHRDYASRLAEELGVESPGCRFSLRHDGDGLALESSHVPFSAVKPASRGLRADIRFDCVPVFGELPFKSTGVDELEVWSAGARLEALSSGGDTRIQSGPDIARGERLLQQIREKNLFHRYKLRPINKTYIFLFRRHEMGHLAGELDDLDELVEAKEEEIARLRVPMTNRYEFRLPEDWRAPRDYPDHEVPKDIPAPDVEAELAAFTVADGFGVNLFAKNPMIANPINLNWDSRGRAWVSTSSTYPHIKPGKVPDDRIVILEDTDHDGVADKHTVFAEGLTVPHSVLPVAGGTYVCSTTEFLFLRDKYGDDVSESRRVIFSGFGNADVHHMIHGLRWAPWGDLHFLQSIYINSFVDTPYGPRRMNGSGVWRYRPEHGELEAFATGMVNPWGFAFDRWGQSFGTDGAGGGGPHYVFPGAAFPSAVGAHRVLGGLIPGKPKNTGAEFISGRHMPDHWQGSLVANDFRANRTVRYELRESGSGYTAKEVETVLHSTHRSFRPVDLKMGPDGALYVVDWYNPIIDHGEVDFHHPLRDRSHGRIWRITAKGRPLVEPPQIAGAEVGDLLEMLKSPEQYTRMQAKRELVSRRDLRLRKPITEWVAALDPEDPQSEHHRVEALWLMLAHYRHDADLLDAVLKSRDPRARAAAVRAASARVSRVGEPADRLAVFAAAIDDEHPRVRLEAINALREMGSLEAANIALRALDHPRDNNINFALELTVRVLRDHWLPAMQAGKEVFDGVPSRLAYALKEVNDPRAIASLLEVVKRGEIGEKDLPTAVRTIAALGEAAHLDALLELPPALLPAIAEGAQFNSNQARDQAFLITALGGPHRKAAAELCGRWGVGGAVEPLGLLLHRASNVGAAKVYGGALAGLGAFDELNIRSQPKESTVAATGALWAWIGARPKKALEPALRHLDELTPEEASHAGALFAAYLSHSDGPEILAGGLAGRELDAEIAKVGTRIAHASGRDVGTLIAALNEAGELKTVALDMPAEARQKLLADAAKSGDAERGREIYHRRSMLCTTCHVIDNEGGLLGPDLTTVGSYMTPESLLESLLNPSSSIKQGYETVIVTKKDNTVVSGLLQRKAEGATLVRDPTGEIVSIPNGEIAKTDTSPVSLMPPGLTAQLRRDELVDLMKYLTSLGKQSGAQ